MWVWIWYSVVVRVLVTSSSQAGSCVALVAFPFLLFVVIGVEGAFAENGGLMLAKGGKKHLETVVVDFTRAGDVTAHLG